MRTTSGLWLLGMAEQFKWLGLPVAELFQQADIPLSSLSNRRLRVPQDNVSRLWHAAEEASGSEVIGLLVGRQLGLSAMAGAAVGLLESRSVVAAINLIMRYQKIIGETSNIHWEHSATEDTGDPRLRFNFYDDQQPLSPHTLDVAMASLTRVGRLVEGRAWSPSRIELRRKVKDGSEYLNYFRCDVSFACDRDVMVLPVQESDLGPGVIGTPEPGSDQLGLGDTIAMVLPEQLRNGAFQRQDIARLLAMSERTLQRRLASEGASFSRILDDTRRRKSEELLLSGDYSQTEVAFLCGFSDLSSFHHAFKRWYGVSPGSFASNRSKA